MKPKYFTFAFLLFSILFSVSCSNDTLLEENEPTLRATHIPMPNYVLRSFEPRGQFQWCNPGNPRIFNPVPRVVLQPPVAHNTLRLRIVSIDGHTSINPPDWNNWWVTINVQGFFKQNIRHNPLYPGLHIPFAFYTGSRWSTTTTFENGQRLIAIDRMEGGQASAANEVFVSLGWMPYGSVITWETFTRRLAPGDPGPGGSNQVLVEFACVRDPWDWRPHTCTPAEWVSCRCAPPCPCGHSFTEWVNRTSLIQVQYPTYRRNCQRCHRPAARFQRLI